MTNSDWISIIALAVAAGALALEIRRWFESGPKLTLSVMSDALLMPDNDGIPRLALTVRNRGNAPTTLTHMILFGFESKWQKFRNKQCFSAVSTTPNIPYELGVNQTWIGMGRYTEETQKLREKGQLYVGVISAHSDKNYLIRVKPPKEENIPEKKVG